MTEYAETLDDGDLEDTLPEPKAGDVIADRYRVVRLLGRGGSGKVYLAEHVELGRPYAIKFLGGERASSLLVVERFSREARLLASLEHPAIASVFDMGRYLDKSPFIVLDYVDGRTLRSILRDDKLPSLRQTLAIMQQLCGAIEYAHDRGVVHRDIKPENVMLCSSAEEDLRVRVLDFGIARPLIADEPRLTPTGAQLGTPHYMAPEQAKGDRDAGPLADIYSLGVIFYELLSGSRPHPGDNYYAITFHLLTQRPIPLQETAPDCPSDVREVVEKCLRREPSQRFETAAALGKAIAQLSQVHALADEEGSAYARVVSRRLSPWLWLTGGVLLGAASMGLWDSRIRPEPPRLTADHLELVDMLSVPSPLESQPAALREPGLLAGGTHDSLDTSTGETKRIDESPMSAVEVPAAQASPTSERALGKGTRASTRSAPPARERDRQRQASAIVRERASSSVGSSAMSSTAAPNTEPAARGLEGDALQGNQSADKPMHELRRDQRQPKGGRPLAPPISRNPYED